MHRIRATIAGWLVEARLRYAGRLCISFYHLFTVLSDPNFLSLKHSVYPPIYRSLPLWYSPDKRTRTPSMAFISLMHHLPEREERSGEKEICIGDYSTLFRVHGFTGTLACGGKNVKSLMLLHFMFPLVRFRMVPQ